MTKHQKIEGTAEPKPPQLHCRHHRHRLGIRLRGAPQRPAILGRRTCEFRANRLVCDW